MPPSTEGRYLVVMKVEVSVCQQQLYRLDVNILLAVKHCGVQPPKRPKRHDHWSTPHWNLSDKNSQSCGCSRAHCVNCYDSLDKTWEDVIFETEQWPKVKAHRPGYMGVEADIDLKAQDNSLPNNF